MISIQQMQYILALFEEGSFQKASEKCFVTQPTLSMQIKKAEEQLGKPLFDRSVHPIKTTPLGKKIVDQIRVVLDSYSHIEILLQKEAGSYKQEVRLGIIPTIATYMIKKVYKDWKSRFNDLHLVIEEMKTEDLLVALETGKIDIGFLAGPVIDTRFRTSKLYDEEIKVYFPSNKKKVLTTDELAESHPWLLTSGNCLRTQMMHFCQLGDKESIDWDYQGGNLELLLEMVDSFGGYTLVPENFEDTNGRKFKSIHSDTQEVPVREVIALTRNRSPKWDVMEQLIRSTQLTFKSSKKENKTVLSWK